MVIRPLSHRPSTTVSLETKILSCGLSLLLALYSAPIGFSPGSPVFPSPQNPKSLNANSIGCRTSLKTSPFFPRTQDLPSLLGGKVTVTSLGRPIRLVFISSFRSMKRLGVFLLPSGWDAGPLQGYPQHFCQYQFIHLGGERHPESNVPCPRTQRNVPGQDPNPDYSIWSQAL